MDTEPIKQEPAATPAEPKRSLLDEILAEEKDRTTDQRSKTRSQIETLLSLRHPVLELPRDSEVGTVEQLIVEEIARIDTQISDRLNSVMHHRDFQRVEATWRGLHKLVSETESIPTLKIRAIDVSKEDLVRDLGRGDYLESALFHKIHDKGFGQIGKEPYGVLIGDFEFGPGQKDMALLNAIARVAAVSHAPFISAAGPQMFGLERLDQIETAGALYKIIHGEEFTHWRRFREDPNSRYVGLVLPRILLRSPYRNIEDQTSFSFNEDVAGPDKSKLLWGNAAYAYAETLTGAFFNYGWCTAIRGIEGGGLVELPFFLEKEGRAVHRAGPTEVIISDTRERELSNLGFIPLCQLENTPKAVFISGQSCQLPNSYYEDEATESAELSARLPNIFAVSRFAHYIKAILQEKLGLFMSKDECQEFLNRWISNYVLDKVDADHDDKARYPLREARVVVEDVPGRPGQYEARAYLRPHYQLEQIAISMRLVAKNFE